MLGIGRWLLMLILVFAWGARENRFEKAMPMKEAPADATCIGADEASELKSKAILPESCKLESHANSAWRRRSVHWPEDSDDRPAWGMFVLTFGVILAEACR